MQNKTNVVIIDDHFFVLMTTKQMLNLCSPNVNVLTYQNPEKFIKDLESNYLDVPQLIICDYNMPEMNGLDVHDALKVFLKKDQINPCFYLVSAEDKLNLLADKFESDFFSGYHQKPLRFEKLKKLVNRSLVNATS